MRSKTVTIGGALLLAAAMSVTSVSQAGPAAISNVSGPSASAIDLVTVPMAATRPNGSPGAIPHPAYNGHRVTLKAIARGFDSLEQAAASTFRWDTDLDGSFDDEVAATPRRCVAGTPAEVTCYDLGDRVLLPSVSADTRFDVAVELRLPGDAFVRDVYPVAVYAAVPTQGDPDDNATAHPENATSSQLSTMQEVAVDDALWARHLAVVDRAGTGAAITGTLPLVGGQSVRLWAAGTALWLFEMTGHRPAYPPGSYAGGGLDPADAARYESDPYTETALRLFNTLLEKLQPVAVPSADEANDTTTPIPGTDDAVALATGVPLDPIGGDGIGSPPIVLAALASSGLAGTVAQTGPSAYVAGRRIEAIVQQLVDFLVFAQIDATSPERGGWFYSPNGTEHQDTEGGPAMIALAAATQLSDSGVYVNERLRGRLAGILLHNQDPTSGLARFRNSFSACGDLDHTGSYLSAMAMLGWNSFSTTDPTPIAADFDGSTITRAAARGVLDRYRRGLAVNWVSLANNCVGWTNAVFDPTGTQSPAPYLRTDGRGNFDAMMRIAVGLRALGDECLAPTDPSGATRKVNGYCPSGSFDWQRQFSVFLIRNQRADGGWLESGWGVGPRASYMGYNPHVTTAIGALALLPAAAESDPVAVIDVSQSTPVCGQTMNLDGSRSFVRNPSRTIAAYEWDLDFTGAFTLDATGPTIELRPDSPGPRQVALRVRDDAAPSRHGVASSQFTVAPPSPVAPNPVAGGPYVIAHGSDVVLDASTTSDPDLAVCGGDTLVFHWDLNDDGTVDATGATASLGWEADLAPRIGAGSLLEADRTSGLPTNPVRLTVTDSFGLNASATTRLTILNPPGTPTPTPSDPTPSNPTSTPMVPAPTPTTPAASVPDRMNAPRAIVRGREVIVKWKAATAAGSPITRYLIDISKGKDKTAGPSATKAVFKRLRPGRYRIRIAARNAIGTSPYSVWVKIRIR